MAPSAAVAVTEPVIAFTTPISVAISSPSMKALMTYGLWYSVHTLNLEFSSQNEDHRHCFTL